MSLPTTAYAVEKLIQYLQRNWKTYVDGVNATRYAFIDSDSVGPYACTGGDVVLSVNGVQGTVTIPGGSNSAAALVALFDAAFPGALACVDDSGRFQLKTANPVAAPSTSQSIKVISETNNTATELGFTLNHLVHEAPCRYVPNHQFFKHTPEIKGPPPYLAVVRDTLVEGEGHLKAHIYPVEVSIEIADYNPKGHYGAVAETMRRYIQVVREAINADRKLGVRDGTITSTKVSAAQTVADLFQVEERGPIFGVTEISLTIRLYKV